MGNKIIIDYRPNTWEELIGQEVVVEILKSTIIKKNPQNAYLFVGIKGCGKTTSARLFAKALNCKNVLENGNPCNECSSCLAISTSRSMDVKEMDMATNRGIDDVREIKESILYAPTGGKYRIIICDEAHQLTSSASSALLKVLEEPPKNVIWILCTTEGNKILETIRTRCQILPFKKVESNLIYERLLAITEIEQIMLNEDEKETIKRISENCAGSVREAESKFGTLQAIDDFSFSKYIELFGNFSNKVFEDIDKLIKDKKIIELIRKYEEIEKDIIDPKKWLEDFSNYLFSKLNIVLDTERILKMLNVIEGYMQSSYQTQTNSFLKFLFIKLCQ